MGEITLLLGRARDGDVAARDALFGKVYRELERLAQSKLAHQGTLTSLDAPSLVHEAYLRLENLPDLPGADRRGFFAYAAGVMRSVIVDYVRRRRADKRGGDLQQVTLSGVADLESPAPDAEAGAPDIEKLDHAMHALADVDDRCHRIVEMRYFAGLSIEDIAQVLDLSPATVKRDWQKARAFLHSALAA